MVGSYDLAHVRYCCEKAMIVEITGKLTVTCIEKIGCIALSIEHAPCKRCRYLNGGLLRCLKEGGCLR